MHLIAAHNQLTFGVKSPEVSSLPIESPLEPCTPCVFPPLSPLGESDPAGILILPAAADAASLNAAGPRCAPPLRRVQLSFFLGAL